MSNDEKKEKLNVVNNQDLKLDAVMNYAMNFLAENGIKPMIIVGQLPDGATIDLSNEAFCGACLADRLEKISELYKEKFPQHLRTPNHNLN